MTAAREQQEAAEQESCHGPVCGEGALSYGYSLPTSWGQTEFPQTASYQWSYLPNKLPTLWSS